MLFTHVRDDGRADFFYPGQEHREVHVTGSFCGWRTPGLTLQRTEHGFRAESGPLPIGELSYKFVVDGRWVPDPLNLAKRPDGNGGDNSVLHHVGRLDGQDAHEAREKRRLARGSLHHLRFHSPAIDEVRGYVIYLPPGYAQPGRRFPTLYLLHGALDWERTWVEKGDLAATLDGLWAEEAIGDLIVVMPRDNGELFRGDGRYSDYVARDVVGHVDYEFRTLAEGRRRGLDGLSTGGFTSVVLGAERPDVFASVGSMSGCHDRRSFDTVQRRAEAMRAAGQRYRISCGAQEPHVGTCRSMAEALDRAGVQAEYAETHGTHDWPLWKRALAGHIRFHWDNLAR